MKNKEAKEGGQKGKTERKKEIQGKDDQEGKQRECELINKNRDEEEEGYN